MVDITTKNNTLREATAQSIVSFSSNETIKLITAKKIPKGDVFEMSKTAGLFAVKNTYHNIPDCHPIPIEFTSINFEVDKLSIKVFVNVKTIYKTGVEVEAMHAASIVALTIYDMVKPVDKKIEIKSIRLIKKNGGKGTYKIYHPNNKLNACVFVCSDSISKGIKNDYAGKKVIDKLESYNIKVSNYKVISDDPNKIIEIAIKHHSSNDIIIFTGGTGLSERDNTTKALESIIDKRIPGIEEAIRSYGQTRMPYAMLSRSIAGLIEKCLILGIPGSTKGAEESIDSIFPHVLHLFQILDGSNHDK
ncbi:MAG: bifunctional molybdenum cofactor biosynthesis protein MoaC/MoaB [Flavobacteriaceae bacterium]|nr:bifunctional molybdenum cofactor biosynthesis protein MoaC/MoaB [Flavobacteriaceae bacterium]